ncbi:hypothetical protein ACO0K0_19365 [Undibacterium sp. SXout11W]|uniref:hypothetical protein n=1 Tax=Undibacterium sp. SXout11W TaxID=3413050 RepID=UPI003BF2819A
MQEKLSIPAEVLGEPVSLRGYIDMRRAWDFDFEYPRFHASSGSKATYPMPKKEAVFFAPFVPGIFINRDLLEKESENSGIDFKALLEILVLHELVHVAMAVNFADDNESQWLKLPELLYIHEAIALKACESLFFDLFEYANAQDVENYLTYVKCQAEIAGNGGPYSRFFDEFKSLELNQLWDALMAASPIKPPYSLRALEV